MSGSTADADNSNSKKDDKGDDATKAKFDCNICLDAPQDPVVTVCGHMFWYDAMFRSGFGDAFSDTPVVRFSWPCIYQVCYFFVVIVVASHKVFLYCTIVLGCLLSTQWLERSNICPVCKSGIDKEKCIPIYGRDNAKKQDPR
jgi:E3 ubiquitin-protein ligase RNF5